MWSRRGVREVRGRVERHDEEWLAGCVVDRLQRVRAQRTRIGRIVERAQGRQHMTCGPRAEQRQDRALPTEHSLAHQTEDVAGEVAGNGGVIPRAAELAHDAADVDGARLAPGELRQGPAERQEGQQT